MMGSSAPPVLVGLTAALLATSSLAQIASDGSLGPAVRLDGRDIRIDSALGERRGSNLFHSFREFDIGPNHRAAFMGDGSLAHIIARVTGGRASEIDGTLATTGTQADLWLINPAGILFGSRAALDIEGSLHVSTAAEVRFADGAVFSALDRDVSSALTVAAPGAFGFLDASPAAIRLDGPNLRALGRRTIITCRG